MGKKVLSFGSEGKLVLKAPDGKIEAIPSPPHDGAYAYLLMDCSSSMEGLKLMDAKNGAIEFLRDAHTKGYQIGLAEFASEGRLCCKLGSDYSFLCQRIRELVAEGSTNMSSAIQKTLEPLSNKKGPRAMVIVTDGMPDDPKAALDAAQQAKGMGIDIITIGTDDADRDFLRQLASRIGLAIKVSREQLGQSVASAARMLPGKGE